MRFRSLTAMLATAGMAVGLAGVSQAAPASQPAVVQASPAAATPANEVGPVPSSTSIDFNVGLQLSDPAGAAELAQGVSDPASPSYHHYLTPAQWEKRFSPSASSVKALTSWLAAEGITVEAVTPDRMTVQATALPSAIERAFGTTLAEYRTGGRTVRLSSGALKAPASMAELISGVSGVDQNVATPAGLTGAEVRAAAPAAVSASKPIPQPPGFRNAPPCSSYYAKKSDSTDPPYGGGYPEPLPYAVCGYVPALLQGAYGLKTQIAHGIDGKGVTVAIVDAYASPTLLSDAQQYSQKNQAGEVLASSQFSELLSKSYNDVELCEASGWYGEQTLDVEAVHAIAPSANILYAGQELRHRPLQLRPADRRRTLSSGHHQLLGR